MGFIRYGKAGHLAFLWCGLVCNAIVSACILVGGSSTVYFLTGVNQYASLILIPLGIAAYVVSGGLRATFISDATHTFALLIIIIVFVFATFATGDKIGSPARMAELLREVAKTIPVEGNFQGSYLTFRSRQGGIFAVQSIITGFGLVNCDQAYWSRAIASYPETTSRAYLLGAICWFIIPFSLGTSLGLAARALSVYSDFPVLTSEDISAGLASVAAATYLLGKAGSVLMLIIVFLSVTSSFAGELIATSTLLSFDVYKRYLKPNATPRQVLIAAQISVFIWAIFAGGLACLFKGVNITLGWVFNFLGVATASGVFPIALSFTWKDMNTMGAVGGSIGGMVLAFIVWLVTAKTYVGYIGVDSLSNQWVSFAGSLSAIFFGGIISVGLSLWKPANFNWNVIRFQSAVGEADSENESVSDQSVSDPESTEKDKERVIVTTIDILEDPNYIPTPEEYGGVDIRLLQRLFKKYSIVFIVIGTIVALIIPVPLSSAPYTFSNKFFTGFVSVIIIWLFFSLFTVCVYPVVEARKSIWKLLTSIF